MTNEDAIWSLDVIGHGRPEYEIAIRSIETIETLKNEVAKAKQEMSEDPFEDEEYRLGYLMALSFIEGILVKEE